MQTTQTEIQAALKVVLETTKAICDTWKETRLPVPQGPIYLALKDSGAIQGIEGWNSICRLLANNGFLIANHPYNTIEPGAALQAAIAGAVRA